MSPTPTRPDSTQRSLHAILAGTIDLAESGRPPHPGGRSCADLCVPACTAARTGDAQSATRPGSSAAGTRGARP